MSATTSRLSDDTILGVEPDQFFGDRDDARRLYRVVADVIDRLEGTERRVTKSQIAFRRRRTFAAIWMPSQYLAHAPAPLVLSVFTSSRIDSPRWREVTRPSAGHFTHHLALRQAADVDTEVIDWLVLAWRQAG
jgi:hypothetical protein